MPPKQNILLLTFNMMIIIIMCNVTMTYFISVLMFTCLYLYFSKNIKKHVQIII